MATGGGERGKICSGGTAEGIYFIGDYLASAAADDDGDGGGGNNQDFFLRQGSTLINLTYPLRISGVECERENSLYSAGEKYDSLYVASRLPEIGPAYIWQFTRT